MDKIQKLRQIQIGLLIVWVLSRGCSINANFAHLKSSGWAKFVDCKDFGWAKCKNRQSAAVFVLAKWWFSVKTTHLVCSFHQAIVKRPVVLYLLVTFSLPFR